MMHNTIALKTEDTKADISNEEARIDKLVFELYGLTEEINLIIQ